MSVDGVYITKCCIVLPQGYSFARVAQNVSGSLFQHLSIIHSSVGIAPPRQAYMCVSWRRGWGLQREFARNCFSIPWTCKGGVRGRGWFLGLSLYTPADRFKISVAGTGDSDWVPLTV